MDNKEQGFGWKCGRNFDQSVLPSSALQIFNSNKNQSGPCWAATQCSPSRSHHTVQVACWSNWILRKTSSAVHTVNRCCGCCRRVFIHFPLLSIFPDFWPLRSMRRCSLFRCLSSLQIPLVCEILWFRPISFWSSHWSVCLVFDAESGVSFCHFLCPSFIWKRCNSHCQNDMSFFCMLHLQHGILDAFILSMAVAVLHAFNPFCLINFSCVNLFIGIGNVTVLAAINVRTAILCCFIIWASMYFLFVWTTKRSIFVESIVSFFRDPLIVSKSQNRNSTSAWQ